LGFAFCCFLQEAPPGAETTSGTDFAAAPVGCCAEKFFGIDEFFGQPGCYCACTVSSISVFLSSLVVAAAAFNR